MYIVVRTTIWVYVFQAFLQNHGGSLAPYSAYVATGLNLLQSTIYGPVYSSISKTLNAFENHRTDTEFEDHMIIKTAAFTFVNAYVSFFYLAFAAPYVTWGDDGTAVSAASITCAGYKDCLQALSANLLTVILGALFIQNSTEYFTFIATKIFKKTVLSFWNGYFKWLYKFSIEDNRGTYDSSSIKEYVDEYLDHAEAGMYDSDALMDDYSEFFVQFGFIVLFLPVLPVMATVCFIASWVEIKGDILKIVHNYLRPLPKSAQDIGVR